MVLEEYLRDVPLKRLLAFKGKLDLSLDNRWVSRLDIHTIDG